jgi:hypothetical protein
MNASQAKSSTGPERERRAGPRYSPNPDVSCRVSATDDTESQPAQIDNISGGGMKMLVDRTYEVGTFLLVQLTGKNCPQRTVMVRVVRVAAAADGKHALGCAFLTPLEGHELLALVL